MANVIQLLLNQIAPGIIHEAVPEYSQFLYGDVNPIAGGWFRLYVTPKTNITTGDYTQPAMKAKTTLQQFTNMLKYCFQCFWYIDDGKFKIEHVSFFKNGMKYKGQPGFSYDTTLLQNIRNGKQWSFGQAEYTFDKIDMPERYEFEWMDEATKAFEGMPIEVMSKFVTADKKEDVTVSGFTSDIDYMLLSPDDITQDGFALSAPGKANALSDDDANKYPGLGGTTGTNGLTSPTYGIRAEMRGRSGILNFNPSRGGTGEIVFYNSGNVVSTQGSFAADNKTKNIEVSIPSNADAVGLKANGTVYAQIYSLLTDVLELPFTDRTIESV